MRSGLASSYRRDERWLWRALVVALLALYLLPRLTSLDDLVTYDERDWLASSANYYTGLSHGDLGQTFQLAHPGVTTMLAGTVGFVAVAPEYASHYRTEAVRSWLFIPDPEEISDRLHTLDVEPIDVLVAARVAKVLMQAVVFAVALTLLRRLLGMPIAALAGTLIALEPFLIAHDRLLHIDGLLAVTSLAALLAMANAVVAGPERFAPWLLFGALSALAVLTRLTAGVIVVVLLGCIAAVALRRRDAGSSPMQSLRPWVRPVLVSAAMAGIIMLALWPAWLVAPVDSAKALVNQTLSMGATSGHHTGTFFLGEARRDPGVWFYPVTVLWRASPVTLLGGGLFVGMVVAGPARRRLGPGARLVLAVLLAYALVYMLGMTVGTKKFDRYILPIYPILCVCAAVGYDLGAQEVRARVPRIAAALPAVLVGLVACQAALAATARPYYLDSFNPLLGGVDAAEESVPVGWGEGGVEAAEFILTDSARAEPEGELVVRVPWGAPWIVTWFLPDGYTASPERIETVEDWAATDYLVVYIIERQRGQHPEINEYVSDYTPAHTVEVDGVELAWVYELAEIPAPQWLEPAARSGTISVRSHGLGLR